jgi:hypothetical protein
MRTLAGLLAVRDLGWPLRVRIQTRKGIHQHLHTAGARGHGSQPIMSGEDAMRQTRLRLRQGQGHGVGCRRDDDFGYNETGPCSDRRPLGP